MNKDLAGGLVLLAIAGAYFWATETIPNSMLDDAFGPRGLPVILSGLLAFLAAVLVLRGLVGLRTRYADRVANDEEEDGEYASTMLRALGFLAIGAGYVLLLPVLGYPVSVALMIATVALYEKAARDWRIPAAAIFGGVLYWLIFKQLLGVAQPTGIWF